MKVVEVINFLHELDLLEAHLDEHSKFMDKIVLVESQTTYSGMPKPLYFRENRDRFSRFDIEYEEIPVSMFNEIPPEYPKEEERKWVNKRRDNREIQQRYIYDKYRTGFDYFCNTDVDEIWSSDSWGRVLDLMEAENCYIVPKVRRFLYYVDALGRSQDFYRITKTTQSTHVRQRGTKRAGTSMEVGWHFTTCYNDPKDTWMKGVGLAQSIGCLGWKNVPTPDQCKAMLDQGILPFLNQQINPKRVMPLDDLSWLPPFMRENPDLYPWMPEEFREGKPISDWILRP